VNEHAYSPRNRVWYDLPTNTTACGVGFVAHIKGTKSTTSSIRGLLILKNLTHRGAVGADPKASDGAGILIQIPDQYYSEELRSRAFTDCHGPGSTGVGMVSPALRNRRPALPANTKSSAPIKDEGQILLGWRRRAREITAISENQ